MARIGSVTLIGGSVGLVVGALFGLAAQSDARKISSLASEQKNTWTADDLATYDRGRTESKTAVALYTIGSIAAVTGVVLWYVGGKKERSSAPAVSFGPTRGGGEVVLSCGF
jgi:hypothetical protein